LYQLQFNKQYAYNIGWVNLALDTIGRSLYAGTHFTVSSCLWV